MIQIFAILFILYEASKMLFPEKYINTFFEMKSFEARENKEGILNIRFVLLFIMELIYLIFVISLIFTVYWYIGLMLMVLALLYKERLTHSAIGNDGLVSIIVLALILIL